MYEYAVSFEIHSDATYGERYKSLMDALLALPNSGFWTETTSFILVRSSLTIAALTDKLTATKFAPAKDRLLVIDHISNVAQARGQIKYPNGLKSHFKSCVIK